MKTLFFMMTMAAMSANAQSGQWFVQGGLGQLRTSLETTGADIKTDTTPSSKSISVGYELNQVVALTAGYRDFGTLRIYKDTGASQFAATMKGSAYTLGAVASWMLADRIHGSVSGGAYRWTNDIDAPQGSGKSTHSGTKAYFGAGLAYSLTPETSVGVNWTRFKSVATSVSDPDVFEAVVKYKF